MGFVLKTVVGALLMPLTVIAALLVAGGLLWWKSSRVRLGRRLVAAGLVLFWAASCEPLTRRAVGVFEGAYPPFPGDSVEAVVVLGAGFTSDPRVPPSGRLNDPGIYRIAEGLALARAQPWTDLVLSGASGPEVRSNADEYRRAAISGGIDPARIAIEPRGVDTATEARLLAPLLRGRRFALVTSASHMPRAMDLFRGQGLDPVAAPTAHLGRTPGGPVIEDFLPSEIALFQARTFWYELLGTVWVRLRGQV